MRAHVLLKAAAVAGASLAALVGACSLGLDASKLNGTLEEGGSDVTVEVGPETNVPPGTTLCTQNGDCGDGGCYSGVCVGGKCKIELCPTPAFPCHYSSCQDRVCSKEIPIKNFQVATMTLGQGGLGCGNSLEACVAVSYPFAFVGPNTGDPVAYPIVDFTPGPDGGAFAPAAVKLTNVLFRVTRIIASGKYVWFLGPTKILAATSQIPVAWIEVPSDPSLTTLVATTGELTLPSQQSVITDAFAGADSKLLVLLAISGVPGTPPSLVTQLNVVNNALNSTTEFNGLPGFDGGARIVASSGDRLVTARPVAGPPLAQYDVEIFKNAGTASAVSLGIRDLTNAIQPQAVYPSVRFASTPAGGVLAQSAVAEREIIDGGATVVGVAGVRVGWFLQQADDTTIESKGIVQVLGFPEAGVPTPDPRLVGPLAAIGEDKAIALQFRVEDDAGTSVRVVVRDPARNMSVPTNSQGKLVLEPNQYMVSGARSEVTRKDYGYAFSRPPTDADGVRLTIFEVGCGN